MFVYRRQEEKGRTEDEMAGWYHRLDGLEFEQPLGVGDGQKSLAWCSPWGHKELSTTEPLNWTDVYTYVLLLWTVCLHHICFWYNQSSFQFLWFVGVIFSAAHGLLFWSFTLLNYPSLFLNTVFLGSVEHEQLIQIK